MDIFRLISVAHAIFKNRDFTAFGQWASLLLQLAFHFCDRIPRFILVTVGNSSFWLTFEVSQQQQDEAVLPIRRSSSRNYFCFNQFLATAT